MRKWLLCAVIGLLALPVTAQDESISPLLRYLPADAVVVSLVRTDEETIDVADRLLSIVGEQLPGLGEVPDLETLLDETFAPYDASFDEVVRPWLGDYAVTALQINEDTGLERGFIAALAVADRAEAEAFVERTIDVYYDLDDYEVGESGDFTTYLPEETFLPRFYVNDETLLLFSGDEYADLLDSNDFARLADDNAFNNALAALTDASGVTGDEYAAISYLNLSQSEGTVDEQTASIFAAAGQQTFAFTLLDDQTMTMDVAWTGYDSVELAEVGIIAPDLSSAAPLDPQFAARLPAGTQLVLHSADAGRQFDYVINALSTVSDVAQQQIEDGARFDPTFATLAATDLGGVVQGYTTIAFAGLTGLNLRGDVLSQMSGDFALYASLIEVESDLQFSVDAGIVATMDSGTAEAIVKQVGTAAERYDLTVLSEDIEGAEAINLPAPLRLLFPVDFPGDALTDTPELDTLVGTDGEVLTVGTRPGAAFALANEGESLLDDPVFTAAQSHLLPDTVTTAYANTEALVAAADAAGLREMSMDAAQVLSVLGVLESATVSLVAPDMNSIVGRFTLTLAEE